MLMSLPSCFSCKLDLYHLIFLRDLKPNLPLPHWLKQIKCTSGNQTSHASPSRLNRLIHLKVSAADNRFHLEINPHMDFLSFFSVCCYCHASTRVVLVERSLSGMTVIHSAVGLSGLESQTRRVTLQYLI